jgi:hypothetical protein
MSLKTKEGGSQKKSRPHAQNHVFVVKYLTKEGKQRRTEWPRDLAAG